MKRVTTPLSVRFMSYFNVGEWWECWEWQGSISSVGYGMIGRGRRHEKNITAHRLSYMLFNDAEIPKGMDICHRCNNRRCVNPDHLYVGTRAENMQQAKQEGRLKRAFKPWSEKRRAKQRAMAA